MKLKLLIFILLACIGCDAATDTESTGACVHDTFIDTEQSWDWQSECIDVSEKECDRLDDEAQETNTDEYESIYYWIEDKADCP